MCIVWIKFTYFNVQAFTGKVHVIWQAAIKKIDVIPRMRRTYTLRILIFCIFGVIRTNAGIRVAGVLPQYETIA